MSEQKKDIVKKEHVKEHVKKEHIKECPPSVSLEEKTEYRKKLFSIIKHINNVTEASELLAERIIENARSRNDLEFAKRLVQKVRSHDISKFSGLEWDALHREADENMLSLAIYQHQQSNDHHPEYYCRGIADMNELSLAELVCDLKSRSDEMGTDLRSFIKDKFVPRFNISFQSKSYKTMKKYIDLLLDNTFD